MTGDVHAYPVRHPVVDPVVDEQLAPATGQAAHAVVIVVELEAAFQVLVAHGVH